MSNKMVNKINRIMENIESVIKSCKTDEELSEARSLIRKILNELLNKYTRVAKASPKAENISSANLDLARLSRISNLIVKKLGREPQLSDFVTIGMKSYLFCGELGGDIIITVYNRKSKKFRVREFLWEGGRLVRRLDSAEVEECDL